MIEWLWIPASAMRIAPVGVFYHDDAAKVREVAVKSSRITHTHKLGMGGAALHAYTIALATGLDPEETFSIADFLKKLSTFIQDETIYLKKLDAIYRMLLEPDRGRVVAELGHGIEAFNAVPPAIFCFLCNPDSFSQAVIQAISLGGDTDTIGAMTGAISGACLGCDAIPGRWKDKLENRIYIEGLAEKLFDLFMERS
ncbi:ADP-ribosylglycohydrolase family protein [Chloroflexota bacterium]